MFIYSLFSFPPTPRWGWLLSARFRILNPPLGCCNALSVPKQTFSPSDRSDGAVHGRIQAGQLAPAILATLHLIQFRLWFGMAEMLENERFLRNYHPGLNICRHCEMNAPKKGPTWINKIHSTPSKLSGSYSLIFYPLFVIVVIRGGVRMN